jgi:hypothetical protein
MFTDVTSSPSFPADLQYARVQPISQDPSTGSSFCRRGLSKRTPLEGVDRHFPGDFGTTLTLCNVKEQMLYRCNLFTEFPSKPPVCEGSTDFSGSVNRQQPLQKRVVKANAVRRKTRHFFSKLGTTLTLCNVKGELWQLDPSSSGVRGRAQEIEGRK